MAMVFYRVEDESSTVYVVRIMYSGRDIRKQLKEMEEM